MSPKRNEDTFINNFHDILEAEIIQTYNDGFEKGSNNTFASNLQHSC